MTHLVHWARRFRFTHTRRAMLSLSILGLCVALVAALLVVGPTFAASPSPSVTLSPSAAEPGASVTVSGANFACKSVDLAFDGTSVGTASPTKKTFSATITVPSAAIAGEYTVTASCGGHKDTAQSTVTVLRSPGADLMVQLGWPTTLSLQTPGGPCSLTVSNLGPDPASNVVVLLQPGAPDYFPRVTRISAGAISNGNIGMFWTIASMLPNTQETLDCVLLIQNPGGQQTVQTIAMTWSFTADPMMANNKAVATTTFVL